MSNMSKERVEAFSDGVFAIILTLLVLELHVPKIANHSSLAQYAAAMIPLIPKVISFIITFFMICIYWVGHHYFFRHLERATMGLVWLNNLLLLWMCFLPFPTAMLGDHPTDQFPILLYGVDSFFGALTFYALRSYASHAKLLTEGSSKEMGPRYSLPAILFYGLSIVLAFVNVYLSLTCFIVVPLVFFVRNMIQGQQR